MEWSVLFMGPVGAGKTEAIRALSDIDVLDTDVNATDDTALLKDKTTVSMDVGVLNLGDGDKIRLYGAPGQVRFDFMWEILMEHAKGVVIMLNHANHSPVDDLHHYLQALEKLIVGRKIPLVIGVTHMDERPERPIDIYMEYLANHSIGFVRGLTPVFCVDARRKRDANALMMAMAGMLEINERLADEVHAV